MFNWYAKNKRLLTLLMVVGVLVALASPVLAYTYRASITISNNSTTNAYTALPVSISVNNTYLASNGFIASSGNDTRVQTIGGTVKPRMVASDRVLTVTDVPASSQTNLYYTTGNTATSSMPVIVGYNGYVTVSDNVDIEPGASFGAEYNGYVDTSVTGYVFDKTSGNTTSGVNMLVPPAMPGNLVAQIITASLSSSSNITDNQTGDTPLYNGSVTRAGEKISSFSGRITAVSFMLSKAGLPVGTANITVRKQSDDSLLGTIDTLNVATLGGVDAWYSFNATPIDLSGTAPQNIRVQFEYGGGDAGNRVLVGWQTNGGGTGRYTTYTSPAYTDQTGFDTDYVVDYLALAATSVTANVTSGVHDTKVSYDGANLKLYIDDMVTANATTAWVGTVPDNANNLIVMSKVTPYMDYFKWAVGGVEKIKYQPNTMIIGTALPNLDSGGSYPGIITWGSNPSGVNVTVGGFVSSGQPSVGTPTEDTTTDTLPEAPASDWFTTPDVGGSLATNPFRPFVRLLSDTTSLTERQAWTWLGIGLVLAVIVGVGSRVKGHHLITGVATGAVVGLLVQQTVFPFYALTFIIISIFAGVIAERKRSI